MTRYIKDDMASFMVFVKWTRTTSCQTGSYLFGGRFLKSNVFDFWVCEQECNKQPLHCKIKREFCRECIHTLKYRGKSRTTTSTPGTFSNVHGNVPWTSNHTNAFGHLRSPVCCLFWTTPTFLCNSHKSGATALQKDIAVQKIEYLPVDPAIWSSVSW